MSEIAHKGQRYPGQHPSIIERETWDAVQTALAQNSHRHLVKAHAKNPSLLSGLFVDAAGETLVTTHATKQGRRYRYYISSSLLKARQRDLAKAGSPPPALAWRLPAGEIEGLVVHILTGVLDDRDWVLAHAPQVGLISERQAGVAQAQRFRDILTGADPIAQRGLILALLDRVVLADGRIEMRLKPSVLWPGGPEDGERASEEPIALITIGRAVSLRRRGLETRLVIEGEAAPEPQPDPALIKALAQAHRWWRDLLDQRFGTVRDLTWAYGTDERYAARVLPLAFQSPALTRAILNGTQPPELTLHRFLDSAGHRLPCKPRSP